MLKTRVEIYDYEYNTEIYRKNVLKISESLAKVDSKLDSIEERLDKHDNRNAPYAS